jgi:hypothetical protein
MRDHPSGILGQKAEQPVFGRCQVHFHSATGHDASGEVDVHILQAQDMLTCLGTQCAAPQRNPQPR